IFQEWYCLWLKLKSTFTSSTTHLHLWPVDIFVAQARTGIEDLHKDPGMSEVVWKQHSNLTIPFLYVGFRGAELLLVHERTVAGYQSPHIFKICFSHVG
ncbi:unnamed protein product, partial [Staurois parvus]